MNFGPFKSWLFEFEEVEQFCEDTLAGSLVKCDDFFGYAAVYMIFLGSTGRFPSLLFLKCLCPSVTFCHFRVIFLL